MYHQVNAIQSEPTVYHVLCAKTGKILAYRELQKGPEGDIWEKGACNKWDQLFKGWKEHKGLDVIDFIMKQDIPKGRKTTYVCAVCDVRPQNKKNIVGESPWKET